MAPATITTLAPGATRDALSRCALHTTGCSCWPYGDAALAKMTAAMSMLSEARTTMVAGHAELADVQSRLGIRTRMGQGPEDKVEEETSRVSSLKEVA